MEKLNTKLNIIVLSLNVKYLNKQHLLYSILKTFFSVNRKLRTRKFTKMGEGLQHCRPPPGEDLQWKGEDLQYCKPSSLGEGLQCCRSSGGKVCNTADLPGEGLQGVRSAIQHRDEFMFGDLISWPWCPRPLWRRCIYVHKICNLGYTFLTRSHKAFILHMCIPFDRTFHMEL